ncbi:prephenate dehydrogenase, partial [Nocardioides sp.]|uniref:prephenate dehydrogenase n=1 Tax=Nocardioides sp. TaxID=35761 RepID=UPI002B2676AD
MTPQAGPGTPSGAAFERICVVGAGLIGGSVARRLVGLGVDVVVVDPDERTRSLAAASGLAVVESVPADRDLVVLSTPLDALPEAMDEAASRAPQAVIIDLGSVKQAPARAAVAAGLSGRYVGVHPMAGTEHTGFEHSDPDLLVGASWAVVHGAAESPLVQVVAWVLEAFEATVVVVGAAEHDRSVALVSHAPHAVAHALLAGAETSPDVAVARWLAAGSFRDG